MTLPCSVISSLLMVLMRRAFVISLWMLKTKYFQRCACFLVLYDAPVANRETAGQSHLQCLGHQLSSMASMVTISILAALWSLSEKSWWVVCLEYPASEDCTVCKYWFTECYIPTFCDFQSCKIYHCFFASMCIFIWKWFTSVSLKQTFLAVSIYLYNNTPRIGVLGSM